MEFLNRKKMFVDILSRPPGFQTYYIWNEPDYQQMLAHTSGLQQKPHNPLLKAFSHDIKLKNNSLINHKGPILPSPSDVPTLLHLAHDQSGHLSSNYTLAKLAEIFMAILGKRRDSVCEVMRN